jgi:hypothetical protein
MRDFYVGCTYCVRRWWRQWNAAPNEPGDSDADSAVVDHECQRHRCRRRDGIAARGRTGEIDAVGAMRPDTGTCNVDHTGERRLPHAATVTTGDDGIERNVHTQQRSEWATRHPAV